MTDDELLDALADALRAPERELPAERIAALRQQAEARGLLTGDPTETDELAPRRTARQVRRQHDDERRRSRRALLRGGAAAGVGVVVGAAGVLAARPADDAEPDDGPPTQEVAFADVPSGVTVTGRTIDHTWGLEVLLDVAGLPAGAAYEVRYATADGPVAAGGFLAVDVPMHCRFNGTALRSAVSSVDVVDTATGTPVLRGTLA